jgi:Histidine kinase-, DNA gyrase B-, and HSP90-like ATPase
MPYRFEQSGLWLATLANQGKDPFSREREQLRNAFYSFRKNTEVLVGRIAVALPSLTKHDIGHLDALWETATLIAGDSYPMNPLEGFVFGGAILLHDAALCYEAYSGGIDAIRGTVVWKDAYAAELAATPQPSDEQMKSSADFSTLRSLHAKEAAKLTERAWPDPDTQQPLFLIEDSLLRKHFGQLIGKIASSHHWDIELVGSEFRNQVNAIPHFPREWRIDPLKLACLLRCADAAHIDHDRAPDFLYALLRQRGVSFNHWQAQNRIARADLDLSDKNGNTIIFTSTRPFPVSDSASWWIAYDAACLIDKEIRASNALLETHKINGAFKTFQVKRVKGVESPERMAEYIKAEGWEPCSAKLHVGNVERLIATLAGEELYGSGNDKLGIAIRELMQNARDAIHARRSLDKGFEGCVHIRLRRDAQGGTLIVEDDGLGMSRRVLTGPLLDFGSSFWATSLVRQEFPGLRSSKFRSVGQFGIGFYSVFMIATQIRVASRRWDEGQNAVNQLVFDKGITLRPLLIADKPSDFRSSISTQVVLRLKEGIIPENGKIEVKRNVMGGTNFFVEFEDYLAALCAGLDVKVFYVNEDNSETEIHQGHPLKEQFYADWLRKLAFSRYQDPSVGKYIDENYHRLRPINENGACYGLAAISTRPVNTQDFLTMETVGGLANTIHGRGTHMYFGCIDHKPKSAKRDYGDFSASNSAMQTWAEDQFKILMQTKLGPAEQCVAAAGLSHFNIDPSPIMRVCVGFDGKIALLDLQELTALLERMDVAVLRSSYMEYVDFHNNILCLPNRALIRPFVGGGVFYKLNMASGVPRENYSVIGCIHRALLAQGKSPQWSIEKNVAQSFIFGWLDAIIVSIRPT